MKKLLALLCLLSLPAHAADTINLASESLSHFRTCLANARAGISRCRILMVGDSTTYGDGAQSSGMQVNSWPAQLTSILQTKFGVPVNYDNIIADNGNPTKYNHDLRITSFSGNWSDNTGFQSIGGNLFQNNPPGGTFSFAPSTQVDSFKVWYVASPVTGKIGVQIDSGSVLSVDTLAGSFIASSTTVTTSLGSHTLNLTNVTGSTKSINIIGIEAWDSTHPGLSILNAGWCGSDAILWTTPAYGIYTAYQPSNMIATMAPDVTIIDLDLNDAMRGNNTTTYQTNLQTIVTAAASVGDVILVTSNHGTTGYVDSVVQPYINIVYSVAGSTIPVIDNWTRDVSYSYQNTNGWMYDTVHMTKSGYADFAAGVAAALQDF